METYFKFKDKGFVENEQIVDETSVISSKSNNFLDKLNFWKFRKEKKKDEVPKNEVKF